MSAVMATRALTITLALFPLLQARASDGQVVNHASSFIRREDPQALSVEGLKYRDVYNSTRRFFSYESPLMDPKPSERSKRRFQHQGDLFDFHVDRQEELWDRFVEQGYVKQDNFELLRDHHDMYPDLDRTFLFCYLQELEPARMLEIGSGESTVVAKQALEAVARNGGRKCNHTAIEPYRASQVPAGVRVLTYEMQEVDNTEFDALQEGDVLFIDSSHVIKPYGDTLTELLQILPRLNTGVNVHIHDIFLPFDYPENWGIKNSVYTEQWAVALLLYGAKSDWEVVWASHLMQKQHGDSLLRMPHYPLNSGQTSPNGGSLWIKKIGAPIREQMQRVQNTCTSHWCCLMKGYFFRQSC